MYIVECYLIAIFSSNNSKLRDKKKMNLSTVLLWSLSFVGCFHFGSGFGNNYWKFRSTITKRHRHDHQSILPNDDVHSTISENYIVQPLDHFDPQLKQSYKQRYYVNSAFWQQPNGPVFLYIGGEGNLDELRAATGAYVSFAQTYGALIFAVEHRFYGQSINDDGLKTENLKYLSSQQALADLAHFYQSISKSYNLTEKNHWISFGGSYPGALSAWFRLKYPHIVQGAVASSAPVKAIVNFQGYNDVVSQSLATNIIGGSTACLEAVRSAFKQVDDLLDEKNFDKLSKDFLSCSPIGDNSLDIFQFVSNLADIFMGIVQYNNEGSDSNVKSICAAMTSTSDAYQNLVTVNKNFLSSTSQSCADNSWKNFLEQMSNTTVDRKHNDNSMRPWIYQTCTQFGYYQTCDNQTRCVFSHRMSLAPNLEICRAVYGITPKTVYDLVDFSNAYYGSNDTRGSNILFVNGLVDPWHALSVLRDLSGTENALVIEGTAHCADMGSDKSDDPPQLRAARQAIKQHIGVWLNVKENKFRTSELHKIIKL
jgi:serine protease 16